MKWNNGYSASYYAYIIDPVSWREKERIEITGGSISRSEDGLRESADIECKAYEHGKEQYIRVYLDAWQNGAASHEPLFTGLATSPSRDIDGYFEKNTLECYSVLKAADDVLLDRGYYVPAGTDGAAAVKDLLSVCPAVSVVGQIGFRIRNFRHNFKHVRIQSLRDGISDRFHCVVRREEDDERRGVRVSRPIRQLRHVYGGR